MARKQYSPLGRPQPARRVARFLLRFTLLFALVVLVLNVFVVRSYAVRSDSMFPTIEPGDRLISMPILYGANIPLLNVRTPAAVAPARGDIVLVRPPYGSNRPLVAAILQPAVDLFTGRSVRLLGPHAAPFEEAAIVKRLVGLPGDVVRVSGDRIEVDRGDGAGFVSEFAAADFLYDIYGATSAENDGEATNRQPAGADVVHPFGAPSREIVLGENEYFVAGDRRISSLDSRSFGPIGREDLLEKLILRYFPFDRFGAP